MFDVVGLGTVAADIVKRVDKLPAADGFAVIKETTFLPGGSGSNVIVQVSRLTGKCAYIAQVGNDNVGDFVINSLKDENVDTRAMPVMENGTTINTEIIVDDSGNKFILINMGDSFLSLKSSQTDYSLLNESRVFFTDLLPGEPAIEGLKKAKDMGLKTVVNMQVNLGTMINLGVDKNMILQSLKYIDVFAPCREGLYGICGTQELQQARAYLKPYFDQILLVTLGQEGSTAFDEKDNKISVAPGSIKVIDTTGAGDSYLGGFIYKYFIDGGDLQTAMEFATRCAAFTSSPVLNQLL